MTLVKELVKALETTLEWASYETEYDGRMYRICNSCDGQNGDHYESCEIENFEALIAKAKAHD